MAREPVVASEPNAAADVRTARITLCIEASILLNEQRTTPSADDEPHGATSPELGEKIAEPAAAKWLVAIDQKNQGLPSTFAGRSSID